MRGADHPFLPLSLLALLAACSADPTDDRARTIGSKLCVASIANDAHVRSLSTANDGVVIGPSLGNALTAHSPVFAQECVIQLHHGDGPAPFGDGTGSHWLSLQAQGKDVLHVRLHYDKSQDRFAVIGFWSGQQ